MPRSRVKLIYIEDQTTRKAVFKIRKTCIIRKTRELSTLCDVDACAIIYSPFGGEVDVWPSDRSKVNEVIERYRATPDIELSKRKMDQEGFLLAKINKFTEQVYKHKKENYDIAMTHITFSLLAGDFGTTDLNVRELNEVGRIVKQYLRKIENRIETLSS